MHGCKPSPKSAEEACGRVSSANPAKAGLHVVVVE